MTHPSLDRYQHLPSARLLAERCRLPIEAAVSAHFGYAWRVRDFADMHDYASHPSAILSDGERAVFVKLSEAAHGLDQFEVELAGLRLLAERAGALIPTPVGIAPAAGGVVLILEAAQAVERAAPQWREMGRALARVHQVRGDQYGLDRQGYFGPIFQDNRPAADWLTFYAERRLWPRLVGAIDSGHLPTEVIRRVERLITRLPGLEIPPAPPALLHGDAQQNNFISTAQGAMLIDPAVYYGHPEMDLAYVDYFQEVPGEVFLGYQEILPIDPGFPARRGLWRIPAYLAAVQVEGPGHLFRLLDALRPWE